MKRKKDKKVISRFFAVLLTLAMVLTLMPASALAAGKTTTELPDTDGLELSKKIELQDDGTYKITMEAYATGETKTEEKQEPEPLDIVLVLDQSGSMSHDFGNGTTTTYTKQDNLTCRDAYQNSDNLYVKVNGSSEYQKVTVSVNYRGYTVSFDGGNLVQNGNRNTLLPTDRYEYYIKNSHATTRLDALMDAVDSFVDTVHQNAVDNNLDHRIAITGFSSKSNTAGWSTVYFNNTEILTGCEVKENDPVEDNFNGNYYPYNKAYNGIQYDGTGYPSAKGTALQNVKETAGYTNVSKAVDYLTAHGGTQTQDGMAMAKDILNARAETTYMDSQGKVHNRKTLVVVFTDGEPDSNKVADSAISTAKSLKEKDTTVYAIGVFDNETDSIKKFMNRLSSNYLDATTRNDGTETSDLYYKKADDPNALKNIFTSIAVDSSSSSTSVLLDSTAVLKDTISQYFDISGKDAITAYTVNGTVNGSNEITWETEKTNVSEKNISLSEKTIEVTGFNYSTDFVAENHTGKKLVVEAIVTANELAAGQTDISSNVGPEADAELKNGGNGAGVYGVNKDTEERTIAEYFPVPTVSIPSYAYVLDFGKKVTIDGNKEFGVSSTKMLSAATATPVSETTIRGNYGTFNRVGTGDTNDLSYTPTTFKWNGIDKAYGLGVKSGSLGNNNVGTNEWYQTKFIPATSVYYEDDFGTGSSATDSSVNIIYKGSWEPDGTSSNGDQSYKPAGSGTKDNYGWDDVYQNGGTYSNGSAHKVNGQKSYENNFDEDGKNVCATAEFTFTGTGVDIYSRTNMQTGQVMAVVSKINADNTETTKVFRISDNLYESGDLYQIPTLALDLKEYGTYKVLLTVSTDVTAHNTQARSDYYLDGIRVYNPMGIDGGEAADAYAEDGETNPYVVEFRDVLLSAEKAQAALNKDTATDGTVFIDELNVINKDGTLTLDETGVKTFQNYGPKNEVYLAPGQAVAFKVNRGLLDQTGTDETKIMVGIKAPEGSATVEYTGKTGGVNVTSATDMYYVVTPDESGCVVIRNSSTSTNLLALTKIKVTNVNDNFEGISFTQADKTLKDYIADFAVNGHESLVQTTGFKGDVDIQNYSSAKETDATVTTTSVWKALSKNVASFLRISE